jgi:hypothetical protein
MIDFLKNVGISDDTLIEMLKNNNETAIFDLSCNEEDAINIINYIKNIGINNIDELLVYRMDIFFLTFEQFVKRLSKFNIPVLVNLINEDYTNIDIINE